MDPFAGYRDSRDQLLKSVAYKNERERQAPLDAMNLKRQQQQFDLGQLNMSEANREIAQRGKAEEFGKSLVGLPIADQQKKIADFQMQAGDLKGAVDMSSHLNEQDMKEADAISKAFRQGGPQWAAQVGQRMGMDPEEIDAITKASFKGENLHIPDGQGGSFVQVYDKLSDSYHPFHVAAPSVGGGTSQDAFAALKRVSDPVSNPDGTPKMDEFGRRMVQVKRYDKELGKMVDVGAPQPEGELTASMMSMNPKEAIKQLGLDESQYESEVMKYLQTGKTGFSSRQQAQRAFVILQADTVAKELNIAPGDVPTMQKDQKAKVQSLIKQRGRIDALSSYVDNMHKQVKQFEVLGKELQRNNPNILNIPIREWEGTVVGNEIQALLDVHIKEVATENAKIASGAVESVKEVSDSAREQWEKVINKNLSYNKMMYVLNGIIVLGDNRVKSMTDRYDVTIEDAKNVFAEKKGVDIKLRPPGDTQEGPEKGSVEYGYYFKGGDPADPANWGEIK